MTLDTPVYPSALPESQGLRAVGLPLQEVATSLYTSWRAPTWVPAFYVGAGADPLFSLVKGDFAERVTDQVVTRSFLGLTGGWTACSPRTGRQGIDGLFVLYGDQGRLRDLLVVESKYGTSQLGKTRDGKQMSSGWIAARLRGQSEALARVASGLLEAGEPSRVPPGVRPTLVPLSTRKVAKVWEDGRGRTQFSAGRGVSAEDVARGAREASRYLLDAADGRVGYRSRLLRFEVEGDQFVVRLKSLGAGGHLTGERSELRGRFGDLPVGVRRSVLSGLRETLVEVGLRPDAAERVAGYLVRNPRVLRVAQVGSRYRIPARFIGEALATSAVSFAGGVALEAAWAVANGQSVKASVVANRQAVGALGTLSGVVVGHGVQYLLLTKTAENLAGALPLTIDQGSLARAGSAGAAGLSALLVTSIGLRAFGLIEKREARLRVLGGALGAVAAPAAKAGLMAAAIQWGTAGTGAPIKLLAGAAQTSAAQALLGGGPVAAGGAGMAGGGALLAATGQVVLLAIGMVVVPAVKTALDDTERRRLVEGRLQLVRERVSEGNQLEW